jgi:Ca2+-binding RTX toxin-like protein
LVGGFDVNEDELFGGKGDDTLTGRDGADSFNCGPGTDTITDFDAAGGDTKTADCENFLYDVSVLNENNPTIGTLSTLSDETVENFSSIEEDAASGLPTATMPTIATTTTSTSNETETTTASDEQE